MNNNFLAPTIHWNNDFNSLGKPTALVKQTHNSLSNHEVLWQNYGQSIEKPQSPPFPPWWKTTHS